MVERTHSPLKAKMQCRAANDDQFPHRQQLRFQLPNSKSETRGYHAPSRTSVMLTLQGQGAEFSDYIRSTQGLVGSSRNPPHLNAGVCYPTQLQLSSYMLDSYLEGVVI